MTAPDYRPPPAMGWWVKKNQALFAPAGTLTMTGYPPRLHDSLCPAAAALTMTGYAPTLTNVSASVSYESTGAGNDWHGLTSNPPALQWTHTAGGLFGRCVIVGILGQTTAGMYPINLAVTYGGQAMTKIAEISANNNAEYHLAFWYLLNPPTGAQTVSVDNTDTSMTWTEIAGTSISYTYVGGVSGIADYVVGDEAGSTMSLTAASVTNRLIVNGLEHVGANTDIEPYSQTVRWQRQLGSYDPIALLGDAAAATSVVFSGTRPSGWAYCATAFDLVPMGHLNVTEINTNRSSYTVPTGALYWRWIGLGPGGRGGLGYTSVNTGRGGGGGGGGGAVIDTGWQATGLLGGTYTCTRGLAGSSPTNTTFTSGSVSLTARAGGTGGNGTDSASGAAGTGGTTTVTGLTAILAASGTAGGLGGTSSGSDGQAAPDNATGSGPGGGGGSGLNSIGTEYGYGGKGGDSILAAGGPQAPYGGSDEGNPGWAARGRYPGGGGSGGPVKAAYASGSGGDGGDYGAGGGGSSGTNGTQGSRGLGTNGYMVMLFTT